MDTLRVWSLNLRGKVPKCLTLRGWALLFRGVGLVQSRHNVGYSRINRKLFLLYPSYTPEYITVPVIAGPRLSSRVLLVINDSSSFSPSNEAVCSHLTGVPTNTIPKNQPSYDVFFFFLTVAGSIAKLGELRQLRQLVAFKGLLFDWSM